MTSDIQYDSIGVVTNSWLDGGFKHELFDFPYIGNVIIPTDELIFFRGVGQPPTSWSWNQVFFGGHRWTVLWKWDDVERINGTHNMSRLWSMIGSVRLKAHRIYIISLNLSYSSTNPVGICWLMLAQGSHESVQWRIWGFPSFTFSCRMLVYMVVSSTWRTSKSSNQQNWGSRISGNHHIIYRHWSEPCTPQHRSRMNVSTISSLRVCWRVGVTPRCVSCLPSKR